MSFAPSTYATYPGLQVLSVDMKLEFGNDPSVAIVHAVPTQEMPPSVGNLTLVDGDDSLTFYDMSIDVSRIKYIKTKERGLIQVLRMYDRRWRWRFTSISGKYNHRTRCGGWATDYTAEQLAAILLDELGETNYDVDGLPGGVFPEVNWNYQNAAELLQALCLKYGCEIVLGTDNRIHIISYGDTPENLDDPSKMIDDFPWQGGAQLPSAIELIGSETLYECVYTMEPVGIDTDGDVKPIDELSYAPPPVPGDNGRRWTACNPWVFGKIDAKYRHLAMRSIFRWFRPSFRFGLDDREWPYALGYAAPLAIDNLEQMLPWQSQLAQCDVWTTTPAPPYIYNSESTVPDGRYRHHYPHPEVMIWWPWSHIPTNVNDPADTSDYQHWYSGEYQIDLLTGTIKFPQPVVQLGDSAASNIACKYPYVAVRAAHYVRGVSGQHLKFRRSASVPGGQSGVRTIHHPDLRRVVIHVTTDEERRLDWNSHYYVTNEDALQIEANGRLQAALTTYGLPFIENEFIGLHQWQPGPSIRWVQWLWSWNVGSYTRAMWTPADLPDVLPVPDIPSPGGGEPPEPDQGVPGDPGDTPDPPQPPPQEL